MFAYSQLLMERKKSWGERGSSGLLSEKWPLKRRVFRLSKKTKSVRGAFRRHSEADRRKVDSKMGSYAFFKRIQ